MRAPRHATLLRWPVQEVLPQQILSAQKEEKVREAAGNEAKGRRKGCRGEQTKQSKRKKQIHHKEEKSSPTQGQVAVIIVS